MLKAILACDYKWNIWNNWKLLAKISEDLKRFKELTSWNTVVMWRKTLESIWKALPNRTNYVITRKWKEVKKKFESVRIMNSISEIDLLTMSSKKDVYIIWWAEIYNKTILLCDEIEMTLIEWDFWECDAQVDTTLFKHFEIVKTEESREENWVRYKFITLKKKNRN